jgi:hypothetical protein
VWEDNNSPSAAKLNGIEKNKDGKFSPHKFKERLIRLFLTTV